MSFPHLLNHVQTKDVVSDEVDTSDLELNIYSTAVYVFLALSAFFVIVSFFGCCGAWRVSSSQQILISGKSIHFRRANACSAPTSPSS